VGAYRTARGGEEEKTDGGRKSQRSEKKKGVYHSQDNSGRANQHRIKEKKQTGTEKKILSKAQNFQANIRERGPPVLSSSEKNQKIGGRKNIVRDFGAPKSKSSGGGKL